jgi:hypothetical protein
MNHTIETWKTIPGFEKYQASSSGSIRNCTTKEVLRHCKTGRYRIINLVHKVGQTRSTARITKQVHILVAAAFHGPRSKDSFVRFIDGDHDNCCPSNLSYRHVSELAKSTAKPIPPGKYPERESQGHFFTERDYAAVRQMGADGYSAVQIAKWMKSNHSSVSRMLSGQHRPRPKPKPRVMKPNQFRVVQGKIHATLIDRIRKTPTLSLKRLAAEIGTTYITLRRHVRKLADKGKVRIIATAVGSSVPHMYQWIGEEDASSSEIPSSGDVALSK